MKFEQLKTKVYELATVSTTQQLKAKYGEINILDMRRKLSWEKALTIIQKHQDKFKKWLDNPPEEYKELFAEVEAIAGQHDKKFADAKQLAKELITMADHLETLSQDYQEEADYLKQEVKAAREIAKQAELN